MAAQIETIAPEENRFETLGAWVIRYGLVLVLGWIGAMKFTAYDACLWLSYCAPSALRLSSQ